MENDNYLFKIIDIDEHGNGIAKKNNFIIFINGVLKNEEVKIKIIKKEKHYAIGQVTEFIKESPDRIKINCPYFYSCGGCSFLHIINNYELDMKNCLIKKIFKDCKVNDIISLNEYNYRNKVVFHVLNSKMGFYEKNSNNLISINKCLLLDDEINKLIPLLESLDLKDISKIMIKKTYYSKEIMIAFYGNISLNKLNNLDVKSIYLNEKLVKGEASLVETIGDKKFTIGLNSFFQTNTLCMEALYKKIKEVAGHGDTLLDLYCGTGTIGIYLSDNFNKVYGIEIEKEAIENAKTNAKLNNITNILFYNNDASKIKKDKYSCLIVDPPRNGLSKIVINKLKELKIPKIIYVSCNPITLKRDLDNLSEIYDVLEITPFNMFPKTDNIECVTVLKYKEVI